MQSLDKCGAIPNQDIDCLKAKCPLWDHSKGMCVMDYTSTMITNIDKAIKIISQKVRSMDNNQRIQAGINIGKKLGLL
jgi:hypothetical protein